MLHISRASSTCCARRFGQSPRGYRNGDRGRAWCNASGWRMACRCWSWKVRGFMFLFSFLIINNFCSSLQLMLMLFYNLNNLTSRTNTSLNYKWVNEYKQQNAWFELQSKYFRSSPPDPSCTVTCTSRCTVLRTFRTWRGGCPSLSTRYAISIFPLFEQE